MRDPRDPSMSYLVPTVVEQTVRGERAYDSVESPCERRAHALCVGNRVFGRTTWPRRALCVGLPTFFQNLESTRLRNRAAQLNTYSERSVS
jgi:hypothetical protein